MTRKLSTFILLGFVLAISGCEKKLFDYRNKYIGNYQLTYNFHYSQMDGTTKDTLVVYKGKVKYGEKGSVKIDWYDGSEYDFELSKKGALSKCNTSVGSMSKQQFQLSFTDDLCGPGPMGSDYTVVLNGMKVK